MRDGSFENTPNNSPVKAPTKPCPKDTKTLAIAYEGARELFAAKADSANSSFTSTLCNEEHDLPGGGSGREHYIWESFEIVCDDVTRDDLHDMPLLLATTRKSGTGLEEGDGVSTFEWDDLMHSVQSFDAKDEFALTSLCVGNSQKHRLTTPAVSLDTVRLLGCGVVVLDGGGETDERVSASSDVMCTWRTALQKGDVLSEVDGVKMAGSSWEDTLNLLRRSTAPRLRFWRCWNIPTD
jgi:hypothetical protein